MSGERGEAARGVVTGGISDLSAPENAYERARWNRLIEIYLPVRASRIGSDLHDGPSQALAFALLRLDAVEGRVDAADGHEDPDLHAVRGALQDALADMRTIAAGLRTPELEQAKPAEIVRRAVNDHQRRSGTKTSVKLRGLPSRAPLATKIALYRVLSEALSNAARHGGGANVTVSVTGRRDGSLAVEVSDRGPGFDPTRGTEQGHLGLAGMRERAELLGGRFEVDSSPGGGTRVRAFLPAADATGES